VCGAACAGRAAMRHAPGHECSGSTQHAVRRVVNGNPIHTVLCEWTSQCPVPLKQCRVQGVASTASQTRVANPKGARCCPITITASVLADVGRALVPVSTRCEGLTSSTGAWCGPANAITAAGPKVTHMCSIDFGATSRTTSPRPQQQTPTGDDPVLTNAHKRKHKATRQRTPPGSQGAWAARARASSAGCGTKLRPATHGCATK
jgi:hypothetical protein